MSLLKTFEENADKGFIFISPGGNQGDQMIYLGAYKLAAQAGLTYRSILYGMGQNVHVFNRDIILYLHRHREQIVSKKQLLGEVWNYADTDIETRTVDIHILKLRKKITSLVGDTPFIVTVRGEGYRLEFEE